jgi:hypothetical protein
MSDHTIPSAEFRVRYARLTEPTMVTANGRLIGMWTPATVLEPTTGATSVGRMAVAQQVERPFTPAPKPASKPKAARR